MAEKEAPLRRVRPVITEVYRQDWERRLARYHPEAEPKKDPEREEQEETDD